MIVHIAPEFGYALITAVLVGFECVLIGFFFPGRLRSKVFNKKYLEDNYKGAARGGYPDMGNGRYSTKLSDEDWLLFNNAQRAHYNFVEGVATYIVMILAAAVYYPMYATFMGVLVLVGRLLFAIGYVSSGANGRIVGALLIDIALVGLLGLSVCSGWNIVQGKNHV